MLNVLKVASELNQMTAKDLQLVSEFLSVQTGEALSNYIIFTLQEKDLLNIEVQESVFQSSRRWAAISAFALRRAD
jgi:hypothetical protein